MRKLKNSGVEVSTLLDIVMRSQEILATCIMSRKMAGSSLVRFGPFIDPYFRSVGFPGNYDISQMHYHGPGENTAPYGYDLRIEAAAVAASA